jgi:hypothetical protein
MWYCRCTDVSRALPYRLYCTNSLSHAAQRQVGTQLAYPHVTTDPARDHEKLQST